MNTHFFLKLFGRPRDIPAKFRDIPPKKFDFPGFEGHTELFGPHPFTWKTPTPPEIIGPKSLGVCSFFVPEIRAEKASTVDFSHHVSQITVAVLKASGASRGSLHGSASLEVEKVCLVLSRKRLESHRNEVKLPLPQCRPVKHSIMEPNTCNNGVLQVILQSKQSKLSCTRLRVPLVALHVSQLIS